MYFSVSQYTILKIGQCKLQNEQKDAHSAIYALTHILKHSKIHLLTLTYFLL